MQSFGINPVLQGYSGMVPRDFKEKIQKHKLFLKGDGVALIDQICLKHM